MKAWPILLALSARACRGFSLSPTRPFVASATAPDARSSVAQCAADADVPSVIVGGGRIGSLLASLGPSTLVKRGEAIPDGDGPIYVCTRNDALAPIIEATPEHRRADLVFLQNGMLGKFLASNGLAFNTQVLLYLAVAKLGERPIDGITYLNPEGLTAATGKWAEAFAARLAKGNLKCRALQGDMYTAAMLEKHVWICSFMMVGALNGGISVGEVRDSHADQMRALVAELCAAGEAELSVSLPEGAYERLMAYGRSVSHFPTAIKEFEWRNGWFYDITKAALASGKPDPCPLHTAGLKELGVID